MNITFSLICNERPSIWTSHSHSYVWTSHSHSYQIRAYIYGPLILTHMYVEAIGMNCSFALTWFETTSIRTFHSHSYVMRVIGYEPLILFIWTFSSLYEPLILFIWTFSSLYEPFLLYMNLFFWLICTSRPLLLTHMKWEAIDINLSFSLYEPFLLTHVYFEASHSHFYVTLLITQDLRNLINTQDLYYVFTWVNIHNPYNVCIHLRFAKRVNTL